MTALDLPATTHSAAPARHPYRWIVFAVVFAANLMDLFDATIVNIAGPSIHADLGGGTNTVQWLSAAYTLAFAVLLIAGARLGDILGRRRLFLVGSAGFTIFSAACAVAPNVGVLIAFRALQGAFGALMIPQGFGLMREVFDDDEFDKATGMFGPAMGLPMIAAPILSGAAGRREPVGDRLAAGVPDQRADRPRLVRARPPHAAPRRQPRRPEARHRRRLAHRPGPRRDHLPADPGPARGLAGLDVRPARARSGAAVRVPGVGAAPALDALIEPSLLTNRHYLSGIAVALALFGAFGGLLLCISLYGQLGEGWSPVHAGLTLTPMVLGMIAGMVGGTVLVGRLGRHVLHLGLLVIAAGAAVLALTLDGASSVSSWDLLPGLFLIGAGAGASIGQLFQFILSSVSGREVGSASGVLEATQQLSTSLGVAILGTIFLSGLGDHLAVARDGSHRVGLPGSAGDRVRAGVPAADARPRGCRALTWALRTSSGGDGVRGVAGGRDRGDQLGEIEAEGRRRARRR